jgi:hypothetical protein
MCDSYSRDTMGGLRYSACFARYERLDGLTQLAAIQNQASSQLNALNLSTYPAGLLKSKRLQSAAAIRIG